MESSQKGHLAQDQLDEHRPLASRHFLASWSPKPTESMDSKEFQVYQLGGEVVSN
jgi:hypothetical protein